MTERSTGLDGLDQVQIIPNYLFGNKPLDPVLDNIDTSLTIGAGRVSLPLKLDSSILFSNSLFGNELEFTKGLIYGSSLLKIPYTLSGEDLSLEIKKYIEEVSAKYIFQWTSDRTNVNADLLANASAIEIQIKGGAGPDMGAIRKTGRMSPSMHLDIESPKDLKKHIDLLKEITGHMVPVIVTLGPGNVYGDVKYCIKAGADAVNIGQGLIMDSPISSDLKKDIGPATIGLFKPALKALKETNAAEENFKLIVSGGFTTSTDIFKTLAMGANGVSLCGTVLRSILTPQDSDKMPQDWKSIGETLAKQVRKLQADLRHLFAMTSAPSKAELTTDCLRAKTYDAASITGLKLLGYEKTLPMWMH